MSRRVITACGVFIGLACIPLFANTYHQYMVNVIFVNFLVCLGLAVSLGYCGQFAFASPAFMGIGAYTVGISVIRGGVPYWFALPLAGCITLLFALGIGFISLRLTRYYLAIASMAFTLAMRFFYINAGPITGGPSGFDIPAATLFGYSVNTDHRVYYVLLPVVFAVTVVTINILRSKAGRAFVAIRDKEEAAAAAAINIPKYKLLAFSVGGGLGGIAGGLYCLVVGRITPDEFGMMQLLLHFLIVVLGGLANISGLVLSTIVVTLLPELIRGMKEWQEIVYGAVILIMILFAPDGLYGFMQKYAPTLFRERLYGAVKTE